MKITPYKTMNIFICRIFLGLILLGMATNLCQAQNAFQLYHCMVDLEKPQKDVMKKFNITEAVLLDGRYIDPNNTGKIDSVSLTRAINQFFPSASSTGLGLLDLEDENYKSIRREAGSKVPFNTALAEYMKMIRIAKRLRPLVQWSMYNVPYVTYYDKNDEWQNQEKFLMPLLEMVDVLTPALYDYYPETTTFADDKAYFSDNLQVALRLGELLKKPVYPYIWHRWHDSNQKDGLNLIPKKEFNDDLNYILSASYNSWQVSGLIWFGAQSYFHTIKPGLADEDVKRVGGSKKYVKENTLTIYANLINVAVKANRSN
jgi:hypothetical protein